MMLIFQLRPARPVESNTVLLFEVWTLVELEGIRSYAEGYVLVKL